MISKGKLICPERNQRNTYRDLGGVEELEAEVVCFHKVQVVHDLIKQVLAFGMFLEGKWVNEDLGRDRRVRNKMIFKNHFSLYFAYMYVTQDAEFFIGYSMIQTHT